MYADIKNKKAARANDLGGMFEVLIQVECPPQKQAMEMVKHGSGIRDIGLVLKLDRSSVVDKLRRKMLRTVEPSFEGSYQEV